MKINESGDSYVSKAGAQPLNETSATENAKIKNGKSDKTPLFLNPEILERYKGVNPNEGKAITFIPAEGKELKLPKEQIVDNLREMLKDLNSPNIVTKEPSSGFYDTAAKILGVNPEGLKDAKFTPANGKKAKSEGEQIVDILKEILNEKPNRNSPNIVTKEPSSGFYDTAAKILGANPEGLKDAKFTPADGKEPEAPKEDITPLIKDLPKNWQEAILKDGTFTKSDLEYIFAILSKRSDRNML